MPQKGRLVKGANWRLGWTVSGGGWSAISASSERPPVDWGSRGHTSRAGSAAPGVRTLNLAAHSWPDRGMNQVHWAAAGEWRRAVMGSNAGRSDSNSGCSE